jgi:hypothetical protein
MGIVDIKNVLNDTAGNQFTFQDIKLGYANGGLQQILTFKVRCKDPNFNIDPKEVQEIIFHGQVNPIDKAIEIAVGYRRQLEE